MVSWKDLLEALDALAGAITACPPRKVVTKIEFTYDTDKDVTAIKFYQGTDLLFTLTFTYDADKDVTSIERS